MMPISIEPITVSKVVREEVTADQLFITCLHIDASQKDSAPPSASITVLPFASNNGDPIYAADDQAEILFTCNLYAAAANIPEIGAAIQAVFAAADAWHGYRAARKADLAAASAAVVSAQSDVETTTAAVAAAESVESAARAAVASADEEEREAAQLTLDDASLARIDAVSARSAAHEALRAAQDRQMLATMAAADPAHPPVDDE
jgi:hypothetical protein